MAPSMYERNPKVIAAVLPEDKIAYLRALANGESIERPKGIYYGTLQVTLQGTCLSSRGLEVLQSLEES